MTTTFQDNISVAKFTVVLFGDPKSGKTTTINTLSGQAQTTTTNPSSYTFTTPPCTFYSDQNISTVILQFYKIEEQKYFERKDYAYYRASKLAIVVIDLTSQSSWDNRNRWLAEIERYCAYEIKVVVVGTKGDLTINNNNQRIVSQEMIDSFVDPLEFTYIELIKDGGGGLDQRDQFQQIMIDAENKRFIKQMINTCQLTINFKRNQINNNNNNNSTNNNNNNNNNLTKIFYMVFNNKVLFKNIMGQVKEIHNIMRVKAYKLDYSQPHFWVSHPSLVNALLYRHKYAKKYLLSPLTLQFLEPFLWNNSNFQLFHSLFPISNKSILDGDESKKFVDASCISGSLEIVKYLFKKLNLPFTLKGFFSSIILGYTDITKYLVGQSQVLRKNHDQIQITPSTKIIITRDILIEGIRLAKAYHSNRDSTILVYLEHELDNLENGKPILKKFTSLFKK
ncbi:hypothetical protein DFA_04922 [Cavenderia fasciculata]|uniref:Uncharacterized protein n=1 Tax=Cavenderia fasciculata TaxID=261658 RepID=F4PME2_CACFS|nr:uncharacterized protein DFA_04922 [Cavenderia fasciculata]EGG22792.1 hypothetical protein DFA_04922 [Cavenderia fasciculata]|eukprot:XP_004360643.1 hypothetical protein DFA_04922 [Cavenderia fasciculata]